jgi:membrane protease YdiL (CAAX protease family)
VEPVAAVTSGDPAHPAQPHSPLGPALAISLVLFWIVTQSAIGYLGKLAELPIGVTVLAAVSLSGLSALVTIRSVLGKATLEQVQIGWSWATARQIALAAGLGVILAFALLGWSLVMPPRPDQVNQLLRQALAAGELSRICVILAALVPGPMAEEFLFRGVLYTGLRRRLSPAMSGIAVVALFTLAHLIRGPAYLPWLAVTAAFATLALFARSATNSLVPGIAMHMAYNTTVYVLPLVAALAFRPGR